MQRYDALLEEDPEGGWVHYEDVEQILSEGNAINDSLHSRIEQNEKSIADWKSRFLQKESIIGSLRTSLAATNDALKERIRISNQLFRDFETEQRHSDRLHARIGGLYSMLVISLLGNIALAVTFYLEILGDIVGKIN